MRRRILSGSSRQRWYESSKHGTARTGQTACEAPGRVLAILGFHKIGEPPDTGWDTWFYIPESTFVQQLQYLRDCDWCVIDAAAFLRGLQQPEALPRKSALLTFDDGCRQFLDVGLPCLQRFQYAAVQFVPTGFIGGRNSFDSDSEPEEPILGWNDLRELERSGVSIQSHGVTHKAFSGLTREELMDEVIRSKAVLEDGLGKQVEMFAYPSGDSGSKAQEAGLTLMRTGYRAGLLYGGGLIRLPAPDPYYLPRLAIGPDTDLPKLLSFSPKREAVLD